MGQVRLPIGISDYKEIVVNGYYFIDKTNFVRHIIEDGSLITMLPRPRRFGKTLNLSILRYFFEKTDGNIYRPLFNGMQIEEWNDFEKYQGKYPVILLTLKDCKGDTFEATLQQIGYELSKEYARHAYLLDDKMTEADRTRFENIAAGRASQSELENALSLLGDLLTSYYKMPPIVLLDEYDTPIHVAYDRAYYQRMIDFMRTFMSTVFKDNTNILRGVITGILRVSKESLFSGLNNIEVDSILSRPFCTAFGFTQEETNRMLTDYGLESRLEDVQKWYNGYLFGGNVIYNPWSLINYVRNDGDFAPYWVNTGSDVLLRRLIADGPTTVRNEMEVFLKGGSIRCVVNDKLAFTDLMHSRENIWSFMLFSGYLKASEGRKNEFNVMEYTLQVPNIEVGMVFRNIIKSWIAESPTANVRLEQMLQALMEGDIEMFELILNEFVLNTLSFYDTGGHDVEKVYQAFLLGLLVNLSGYEINSNREAGLGRYDILLRPKDIHKQGIIMELKVFYPLLNNTVEETLASALAQIEQKKYESVLREAGVTDILKLAITFDGKRVWMAKA